MKALLVLSLFMSFAAQAAQFDTYICKSDPKKLAMDGPQYTVVVKETANLKDTSNKYDYVKRVDLTVSVRGARLQPKVLIKGQAKAYIEDVVYRVVSKDLGVSFINFLDEMEEARITLYRQGYSNEISLTCDYAKKENI